MKKSRTAGPHVSFYAGGHKRLKILVGAVRFELTTPCAQGRCATGLRYAPTRNRSFHSSPPRPPKTSKTVVARFPPDVLTSQMSLKDAQWEVRASRPDRSYQ